MAATTRDEIDRVAAAAAQALAGPGISVLVCAIRDDTRRCRDRRAGPPDGCRARRAHAHRRRNDGHVILSENELRDLQHPRRAPARAGRADPGASYRRRAAHRRRRGTARAGTAGAAATLANQIGARDRPRGPQRRAAPAPLGGPVRIARPARQRPDHRRRDRWRRQLPEPVDQERARLGARAVVGTPFDGSSPAAERHPACFRCSRTRPPRPRGRPACSSARCPP